MKALFQYIYTLSIAASLLCFSSCVGSVNEKLHTAESIVHQRPDSAYLIIREIDYNDLEDDSLKAKYILTKAITNLRIGRSLITDTLLNDAAEYYVSVGDTANWVLASQMLSGYDFTTGNPEDARLRLANMIPRIKNQELLWDTYIHLLEIAINSRKYDDAYNYADWLLNHTNIPDQILRFSSAKGGTQYYMGNFNKAISIFDSIIASGTIDRASRKAAIDFYSEYAEMLDAAGYSAKAIDIIDNAYGNPHDLKTSDNVTHWLSITPTPATRQKLKNCLTALISTAHNQFLKSTQA